MPAASAALTRTSSLLVNKLAIVTSSTHHIDMFLKQQFKLFYLFLVMQTAVAHSQECTITFSGRIVDADTNLPVNDVSITLMPSNQTIRSHGHGYYSFSRLCPGNYTIQLNSLGFKPLEKEIKVEENTVINFSLEHEAIVLHDVEVVGHRSEYRSTAVAQSLNAQQMEESRGAALAQALSKIAGVSMLSTGGTIAKPVINGMHSNRVLILNNGVRLEGQQWGAEHAPEVDPFTAKTLTVVKGAEGVRYGADAMGGVVLVEPAPLPIEKKLSGEFNLVGASNGRMGNAAGMLEGGTKAVENLTWRVQGSYKKAGNIHTSDYFINNTGVNELNFSGALGYSSSWGNFEGYFSHFDTELGIFEGAHVGSISDIYQRIELGRPLYDGAFTYDIKNPKQRITHDLAKVKMHHDFANGAYLDVQYAFQLNHRREYDVRLFESPTTPSMDLKLTTQTLDAVYEQSKFNKWRGSVGMNSIIQVNNNTPGTGTTPLIPNFDSYTLGVFGIERYIGRNYELEAGLRYDFRYFDAAGYRYDYQNPNADGSINQVLFTGERNFSNISGSLGGVWNATNQLSLRSNIGLAWRAPAANELYSDGVHHGAALYEIGDPDLKSEQGYKWVNSINYISEKLNLNLDLYGQYIRNYIFATPQPDSVRQTIRGTFPIFIYEQKDARFWGLDFNGSYVLTNSLSYSLNIALVRAKNLTDNVYLPYIPSDRLDHNIRWSLGVPKRYHWHSPFIQFGHRFVARQTRYEPNTDYVEPPPAYHVFNIVAGTKVLIHKSELGVNLAVDNVFNNLYKDYMNRFRYYTDEMGRNITLRLLYKF